MSEKTEEKRRFHRIFYQADALLTVNDAVLPCKVLDLSLKGCLLELSTPWAAAEGQECRLTLELSEQVSIVMAVTLVHQRAPQYGFKCLHIDIDSISILRRLVELNLGDSELLERELAALTDSV